MKLILSILIVTNLLFGALNRSEEIVTDESTLLQWQDDAIVATATRTWAEAIDYCENTLDLGGYDDWRLPNKKELLSIADRSRHTPAIDSTVFVHTAWSDYWSSTTHAYFSYDAWHVHFYYGTSDDYRKTGSNYVRCVRGGQFDPLPLVSVRFASENPADDTVQREPFTKQWKFGSDLGGYSVEVVSSNFFSYDTASISGSTISMILVPSNTIPLNIITLKLKDPGGQYVTISGSPTFWARNKTNHAPRLADGQLTQLVSATNEPAFIEIATYDADGDTVTLSIEDDAGGYVGFDPDNPNRLFASFSDGNVAHTIKVGLNDGNEDNKEKVVKAFNVMQFNQTSIDIFYSDVDKNAGDYIYDGIAFGTLKGVVWGQPDPNDPTKRIFRPTDPASLAEALAMVINAEAKAGLITLQTSNAYQKVFPEWAMPYYTFARETGAIDKETLDLSTTYPTREQIAKFIVKTLDLDEKTELFDLNVTFSDASAFSDEEMHRYAKIAHVFGLFMTGATAKPQETISRAELAMVIKKIFMTPTATLLLTPDTVEYGETLTASLTDIHAEGIDGTSYTLYDASAQLQTTYIANRVPVANPIESANLPRTLKTLYAVIDNGGVRNLIEVPLSITFTDQDSDGIQDTLDEWISDVRYIYDDNNNGIPDILDSIYSLEAYTVAGSIQINGQTVSIEEIIRDGYLPYIAGVSNAPAILWQNSTTGAIKFMPINNMIPSNTLSVVDSSNTNLLPKGIGDFTGDGKPDILFHNQNSGNLRIWEMDGTTKVNNIQVLGSSNTNLKIAGVGDFDGDGDNDIATFNTNSGALRIWVMEGIGRVDNISVLTGANVNLIPRGVGDMNNDEIPDIVLRNNNSGTVRVWIMNSDFTRQDNIAVTSSSNTNLELRGVMDINGDGNNDILNYNTNTGKLRAWLMDGELLIMENAEIVQDLDLDWSVRN